MYIDPRLIFVWGVTKNLPRASGLPSVYRFVYLFLKKVTITITLVSTDTKPPQVVVNDGRCRPCHHTSGRV
jgi:hypothetical protein